MERREKAKKSAYQAPMSHRRFRAFTQSGMRDYEELRDFVEAEPQQV